MDLKNKVDDYAEDFDGVFRFTNDTEEDFVTLWNNKEYTYPAHKTVRMIIAGATLEEIQQIRKYFAKRLAEREYFKSKAFNDQKNGLKSKNGERVVIPSMYNEKVLQPYIDRCLTPLEETSPIVEKLPEQKPPIHGSRAFSSGSNENPFPKVDLNDEFKEKNAELLSMSSKE